VLVAFACIEMEDEILEIGDDGAFEIVSTKPVKQAAVVQPNYDVAYHTDDEDDELSRNEVLEAINTGDFKIYKSAGFVYVIVRLPAEDKVSSVGVQNRALVIRLESGKSHCVPLSSVGDVDAKGGRCTIWKDYVTVKYACV
jgi:hypothetical protein